MRGGPRPSGRRGARFGGDRLPAPRTLWVGRGRSRGQGSRRRAPESGRIGGRDRTETRRGRGCDAARAATSCRGARDGTASQWIREPLDRFRHPERRRPSPGLGCAGPRPAPGDRSRPSGPESSSLGSGDSDPRRPAGSPGDRPVAIPAHRFGPTSGAKAPRAGADRCQLRCVRNLRARPRSTPRASRVVRIEADSGLGRSFAPGFEALVRVGKTPGSARSSLARRAIGAGPPARARGRTSAANLGPPHKQPGEEALRASGSPPTPTPGARKRRRSHGYSRGFRGLQGAGGHLSRRRRSRSTGS
jgi:hypothetical protein